MSTRVSGGDIRTTMMMNIRNILIFIIMVDEHDWFDYFSSLDRGVVRPVYLVPPEPVWKRPITIHFHLKTHRLLPIHEFLKQLSPMCICVPYVRRSHHSSSNRGEFSTLRPVLIRTGGNDGIYAICIHLRYLEGKAAKVIWWVQHSLNVCNMSHWLLQYEWMDMMRWIKNEIGLQGRIIGDRASVSWTL